MANYYSDQDKSRMRYYLLELEEKFQKYPESLCLRNGIVHIRSVLGLPKTIEKVDPIKQISQMLDEKIREKQGR
jgi:hypothetical protein